jgi:AAA family ATPase
VPNSLLLTARLTTGQKVQIFPLLDKRSSTSPSVPPSLRDIQEAGTIQLKEISSIPLASSSAPESKQRDWLRLLLRESLGPFLLAHSDGG